MISQQLTDVVGVTTLVVLSPNATTEVVTTKDFFKDKELRAIVIVVEKLNRKVPTCSAISGSILSQQ